MNCEERNIRLLQENIEREDLWPKIKEFKARRFQFRWEFGLTKLPESPGVITVRGPRQSGKSTWLEFQLLETNEDFGHGTGFVLNGDEIYSHEEFESALIRTHALFSKASKVRRIFIDEITQIPNWERVIKRLIDRGELKDTLIVSTGSNARDLRRGSERLPGRKGNLKKSEYLFLPISYKEYLYQTRNEAGAFQSDALWVYILTGGSPLAIHEFACSDKLDETFISVISDWIMGDFTNSGRSRLFLLSIIRKIIQAAPNPISYTKLAQEAGLANNSAALDYVDRLADLLCVKPMMQWDADRDVLLARKPSKLPFINMAVAWVFHPKAPRYLHEIKSLEDQDRGAMFEWIVAQEIWRREQLKLQSNPKLTIHNLYETDLAYWASKDHEIDFVTADRELYEVKAGATSAADFAWFPKVFPKKRLHVISASNYETDHITGMTLERFLLNSENS